ncbi:Hydrolase, alpha/beta fold family [Sulfitobacter noctilucicola]|uniref:Pimeloyl-ACP methyl ester carboxylesterase n=1 Tax=Sulfitobacter noctilucicola TaxID=1342301 RepID=A0A7W6M6Q1_9RHOB|nr:alpha/beta hydrolase [Sulfitobacter noctilucicola]KIN62048.1 Hydrolase, alpha/beta fold family [Sulfitobacter noctilucicola]MBB4173434.1 pimeloyl-ACP methyl ester carboxylesterase [Sulfitobacter noctilucicola]
MTVQQGFAPHIATLGDGPRQALALHCTMAFGGAWAGISKALPELTLIAPDMPSHGRSPDWDGQSDFAETTFAASLAALPDDGPVDVIGHSFGAVIGLMLAIAHPERLRSLTVIEPVFFAVAQNDAPETLAQHAVSAKPFNDAIQSGAFEKAARAFNRMWSSDAPAWDSLPERTRAAMTRGVQVVPDTQSLLFDDTAGLLAPGALDACSVPTLVLRGEDAHAAIIATHDGLLARLPNATGAVIKGAGHMAPISHPAEVATEIGALLGRS